jgi:peroxiredoxin Q/BCP
MARTPRVGDPAPDFTLAGTAGDFKLSDRRGERVVLLFYPGDDTPVCTRQFCSYRDNAEAFAELEATVVGISSQDLDSHRSFAQRNSLNVPLLADVGGKVASLYSATRGPLGTKRAVIIVGPDGIVRHRHDHALGLDFQTVDELREALEDVPAAA